jgi:hypothetical protein
VSASTTPLYVATNAEGRQLPMGDGAADKWPLPAAEAGSPGERIEADVLLLDAAGLIGHLDERIWVAEPLGGTEPAEPGGSVRTSSARLLAPTPWDAIAAAAFALDCAGHIIGGSAGIALSGGKTVGEALADARQALEGREVAAGGPLARVRDLALLWRLRREGRSIGDAAFAELTKDTSAELEAMDDPVWTAIAAARDALLAAVEAVQHAVLPHVTEFEGSHYEEAERTADVTPRAIVVFEPMTVHRGRGSWVPAWVAADDAAERARQSAKEAGGPESEQAELAWQVSRLRSALGEAPAEPSSA